MRSFVRRDSHVFQAKPDLMPLGAVLLALMMVFVFQLPQPATRIDHDMRGNCWHSDRIPLNVQVYLDENGDVRLDDRSLSRTGIAAALTSLRRYSDEYLTVELRIAPNVAYEDMVATVAAIKTAGVDAFGFAEY